MRKAGSTAFRGGDVKITSQNVERARYCPLRNRFLRDPGHYLLPWTLSVGF